VNTIKKLPPYIFYFTLIYLPISVLLANFIGSLFNSLELMKAIKDVIPVIGLGILFLCNKNVINKLKNKLFVVIAIYFTLTTLLIILRGNSRSSEILGLVYNLRFLTMFIFGFLLTIYYYSPTLTKIAFRVVICTGILVASFAIIQVLFLPDSALGSVGYSRETGSIPVFYISDITKTTERAFSTLKDPNSLGSFLIIILCLVVYAKSFYEKINIKIHILLIGLVACAIYLTYSRSAWLGSLIAIFSLVISSPKYVKYIRKNKKRIVGVAVALVLAMGVLFASLSSNQKFNNLIFHVGDNAPTTSNSQRVSSMSKTIKMIAENPLGYGPGSAGPTSLKGNSPLLPENYYLQIAHETGIIGLILFIAICMIVLLELLGMKDERIEAKILIAAFIGLSFTNLLVHIWANEAVAYTWWALAGLIIGLKYRDVKHKTD